jgi:O-antigen/teichoic acid export membrane protein
MAILQGLSENGLAIKYLVLGLILKGILQFPMIFLFKIYGPLVATNLGLLVIVLLSLKHLEVQYNFNLNRTSRRLIGITAFSIGMFLIVKLVEMGLGKFLNPDHRITALILVILSVGVGIAFYGFAALKTDLAQKIMGSRIENILVKFHIHG